MYKFLSKYGLAVSLGVALLMIAISGLVYVSNPEAYTISVPGEEDQLVGEVSGLFVSGYILVGLAAISALLVFPVLSVISNPKSAIQVGAGILVVGVIYLVFSSSASTELTPILANLDTVPTEGDLKFTSGVIGTGIALVVLSVVALIGSEIYKIVK